MAIIDVMIHILEKATAEVRLQLAASLRCIKGLTDARFGETTPQLIIVSDDPERVDASAILANVEAAGYQARLVGL